MWIVSIKYLNKVTTQEVKHFYNTFIRVSREALIQHRVWVLSLWGAPIAVQAEFIIGPSISDTKNKGLVAKSMRFPRVPHRCLTIRLKEAY